ncbi:DUF885 family protein [Parvularcula sp. IMCC14364]|uniref:DUF885 domain-containing protein n=1 Tax=Parvularcula sp. IMCC14364 TaxID=3067902 RepID=UPI0027414566|nr:DUF885 domain-containing protein [Parvularcula sp. IMCC14364]
MRKTLSILLATTMLTACGNADTDAVMPASEAETSAVTAEQVTDAAAMDAESARLNIWFEEKFEEQLAFSPIQQTFLGRKTDYDKIDQFSRAAQLEQLDWQRQSVADMKAAFDYDQLTPEAQISWDIWEYQLELAEAAVPFQYNAYIFEQMQSIHSFFPQLLITFHNVETESDMEAYISRINESARALRQLIDLSKENAERGVRPPRFSFEFVIDEASKIITGVPFDDSEKDSDIWTDVQSELASLVEREIISQDRADEFEAQARTALTGDWQSAYEELIAWQEEDIVNTTEDAQGVSALPDGIAYYNERLTNQTTTNLTADEIHEIGLSEVARLRTEMITIKDEFGFDGDLPAFFKFLRDNKDDDRLYFPNEDEGRQGYIDEATAAIDKIKAVLPEYFGILPKADLEVRRVEAFREQDGAAQHYFPGTPDGARPGIYYAHLSDMSALPKRELEVIAYHEGLPGHHMQISIAQELESVPTFRTQAGFTAYVEGWALYSEWLAKEMPGTYEDSLSEFGRLGSEMWRAVRLVVDTGLHAKGWSEEQAVEYFLANTAAPEAQAGSEVQRYIVLPGQATSYKIGMLKIQELRRNAEAELGDDFDIRGFHDTVLGGGAMPLTILERRVEQWVESVKSAT